MNDKKRILTLAWLMKHASLGELTDQLDEECRAYAVAFVNTAMDEVTKHRDPVDLAVITVGTIEGEFHGAD